MLRALFTLACLGLAAVPAWAEAPLRFTWQAGQVQTLSVKHITEVTETLRDEAANKPNTSTVKTELVLTRRWEVKAVDAMGVATLEMSILKMKQSHTKTDGETIEIDSATEEGAKVVGEYLNKPIVTVRVDARGQVLEAKSQVGEAAASRLLAELPFRVVLPEAAPAPKATWERPFNIVLDPPLGTGEKYDAVQTYTYRGMSDRYAVFRVATTLKNPPMDPGEMQPLVSWLWEGDVFVDASAGRYAGAQLTIRKEIANHAGEGSKFVFASEYTEAVVTE